MLYLNVWLTVTRPEDVDDVARALRQCIPLSRVEAGCVRYEIYHSQADRSKFLLVEHWETRAHWEAHRAGRAFLEYYQPHVIPKVTREPHISDQLFPE